MITRISLVNICHHLWLQMFSDTRTFKIFIAKLWNMQCNINNYSCIAIDKWISMVCYNWNCSFYTLHFSHSQHLSLATIYSLYLRLILLVFYISHISEILYIIHLSQSHFTWHNPLKVCLCNCKWQDSFFTIEYTIFHMYMPYFLHPCILTLFPYLTYCK